MSCELDSDGSGDGGVEEVERWFTRLAIKDLEKRNSRFLKMCGQWRAGLAGNDSACTAGE